MNVILNTALSLTANDTIVVPLTREAAKNIGKLLKKGEKKDASGFKKLAKLTEDLVKSNAFGGKKDEMIEMGASKVNKSPRVIIYGLGKEKNLDLEETRETLAKIARLLERKQIAEAQMTALAWTNIKNAENIIGAMAEGALLSSYKFDKYKKKKKTHLKKITIIVSEVDAEKMQSAIGKMEIIVKNTLYIRDLVNEGGDVMNPDGFEKEIRKTALAAKLKLTVFDHAQLKKLGCNLILAVGMGSQYPGRMFILEYRGDPKSKEIVALVGKGVTFDTGGVNVKTGNYMEDMNMDMAGAGAVLGAIKTAAELKLKKNIVTVIPCAENAIGSKAFTPGYIIKGYNGTTVEVLNTDAEGRLILADALAYTAKKYKPKRMINLATLTGSILVSLGENIAGLFGNDTSLINDIEKAAKKTYERVWHMPLDKEYTEEMKSRVADLRNIGDKYAGACTAAAFLQEFVDKTPWAHIDIAGTAWARKPAEYQTKGATGYGVRLLTELLLAT